MTLQKLLDEYVIRFSIEGAVIRETRIRLLLRPRPRLLPAFLWWRIVSRLLVIEEWSS